MAQHRVVWLAVPGGRPGSVVVDASGRLPREAFTIDEDTTLGALQRRVLPGAGITGRVLDCFLDVPPDWTPDSVIEAIAAVEPVPEGWTSTRGWRVVDVDGCDPQLSGVLAAWFERWAAEQLGIAQPDPLRPAWTYPGWFEQASAWIGAQLAAVELPPPDRVEVQRVWGISAVLRAEAPDRRYWFKAICEHFRREAPVTAVLHDVSPGLVAPVVAVDSAAGWLLLGDLGVDATGDAHSYESAYPRLRELQRAAAGRLGELIEAGAAIRPLAVLAEQLADVLADPFLAEWHGASPERQRELVDWVAVAVERVAELGIPDVFVHGDFHPGNVASTAGGRVIFDWSDAALAPPFVDVPTWLTWLAGDADGPAREAVWRVFAEQWSDVLPVADWLEHRSLLEGIAGAYHMISYAGIVGSLDELRRPEHARGVTEFFAFLEPAVPTR